MRRKEREISDRSDIESIIHRSAVCRLALSVENRPYIVPLCFGYEGNTLYFHSAPEGKKLDILRENDDVCFEFDIDVEAVRADDACDWGMKYRSIVGFGKASFIEDVESKRNALDIIMKQYSGGSFSYSIKALEKTTLFKVEIENMSGKQAGY